MSTQSAIVSLREKLTALAPAVEGSSLYLLRAIEEAVDSLHGVERLVEALIIEVNRATAQARAIPIVTGVYLDSEDIAIKRLEDGYRALEERLPRLLLESSTDDQLDGEQKDRLHTSTARCAAALAALIEALKDLRAAIISHDLAAEPRPSETFDSPDALIASLRANST